MAESLRMPWLNSGGSKPQSGGLEWLPVAAGSSLVVSGLAWAAVRRSWLNAGLGAGIAAGGGFLIWRGAKGNSAKLRRRDATVMKSVTILKPVEEIYRFWRDLENLPRFMKHLKSVRRLDDRRSHWIAAAPFGRSVEWDAELLEDVPNQRLTWWSLPGSDIEHRGSVEFRPTENRGTEVHVRLDYHRPGGKLGEAFAMAFLESPEQQIREDLRRFKALIETGELPTIEGQPSGRRSLKIRAMEPFDREMLGNRRLNERTAV